MVTKLTLICVLICFTALSFGDPAGARQSVDNLQPTSKLLFSIGASVENSDNIYLRPTNKVSDKITHLSFYTDYKKKTPNLYTDFNLLIDDQNYQNNTFSDQTTYTGIATLDVTMSKDKAVWETDDRVANLLINTTLANTPDNYQNVNYFLTGPKFIFFKNDKDSLTANIKYQNFYTQKDNTDLYGSLAGIKYLRNLTRTFAAGIDINYNDKKYKDKTNNSDYSLNNIALKFKNRTKLSNVEIDVGESYLNIVNAPSYRSNLFRAKYNYRLGVRDKLILSYRRELQDYAGLIATSPVIGGLSNITSNVFLLKEGIVELNKQFGFSNIKLSYVYFNSEYTDANDPNNTIRNVTSLTFTNNITNSLSLELQGSYAGSEYPGLLRTDTSRIYMIAIKKTFINKYDLGLSAKYTNQGSTDGAYIYDELRVALGGHYYFR